MDGGDGQRCTHANSKTRTATAREGRSPTPSTDETGPPVAPASPFRGWEFFGRARKVRKNAPDLGAKHSHSAGYGEHLQRRAGAFWRARRAWIKDSQPLKPPLWRKSLLRVT